MDAAVAGLCGPLRGRVLQTVRAQVSGINAYKYRTTPQRGDW